MSELMDIFIEETKEHLEILDEGILYLEKDPGDKDKLNMIFRAAHTIKGSSAAMGYAKMQKITHAMEDVLHSLREGRTVISTELIKLLLECHDFLETCLSSIVTSHSEIDFEIEELIMRLNDVLKQDKSCENSMIDIQVKNDLSESSFLYNSVLKRIDEGYSFFEIRIKLVDDLPMRECTIFLIYHNLEEYMEIIRSIPDHEDIKNQVFNFQGKELLIHGLSSIEKEKILHELNAIIDIEEVGIEQIDTVEGVKRIIGFTDESFDLTSSIVNGIIFDTEVSAPQNGTDLNLNVFTVTQEIDTICKPKEIVNVETAYVRIPTGKVDTLVDMIGELIILQSLLEEEADKHLSEVNNFMNNLLRMARIMKDVQNVSMSLRMVPLKSTFQKILRIGRDTASELKKNVNILLKGEETEIDRSVAEKIVDPLMHMVRNSIFHGIESSEERAMKGKNTTGTVILSAYSKRGNVYISIEDDGKGINTEKIYEKALERNLAEPGRSYSDEEIIDFIFLPGFSTSETVNSISGRGVGMDVVRTEVRKIGGKIEVVNKPGEGSNFILKIPINLAVINGTIIDVHGNSFIIPTLHIKQTFKAMESHWISVAGKRSMVNLSNAVIPVIPLGEYFGYESQLNYDEGLIIVLELEQKLKAIHVRNVIGKREIVVKPLGEEFQSLEFVSGASILGNGRVALILDVDTLFGISE